MMIVYRLTGGIASDLRFVPEGYIPQGGELTMAGDVLPSVQALSDPAAWQAKLDAKAIADQRAAIDAAERQQAQFDAAILALVNATPAQLMTYANNNFPTLTAPERNKMGVILNILAVAVRPQVRP